MRRPLPDTLLVVWYSAATMIVPIKPLKRRCNMADVPDMQMIPYPTAQEPRNFVEQGLQRYNELLERLAGQMDELLELARAGQPIDPNLAELLISLRESLRPRHGLCIDRACFSCRVHEEAIKEHVLLYVDWKLPGTVQQLERLKNRN